MIILHRLAFWGMLLAAFFGIAMVYTGMSMALRREYRYTKQVEGESQAAIIFNLAVGFLLLGLVVWLTTSPPAWWPLVD